MAYEIIYECNSINNKNVRQGELNILEKHEEQLYFQFGSDEMNIKKRFYNDVETLNKDFEALLKLKEKETETEDTSNSEELRKLEEAENKTKQLVEEINKNIKIAYEESEKEPKKENRKAQKEEKKEDKKEDKLDKYKIIKRRK